MSVQLIAWAYAQSVGSGSEKAVLIALANRANHDTGRCDPSLHRVAEETEFSYPTVKRAVASLEQKGLLKRVRKRKQDGSYSGYSFTFPGITMIQPEVTMIPGTRGHHDPSEPEEDLEPSEVTDVTSAADVQSLVKEFVDLAREQQTEPPKRVIGQIARELKTLSAEATENELRAALKRLLERGLHPSSLPSALFDVRQRGSTNGSDPLGELLAAHDGKWPTGSRLVRGSGGAAYVHDVLGYDTPNHAVRWSKPTRPEVLAALRKDTG